MPIQKQSKLVSHPYPYQQSEEMTIDLMELLRSLKKNLKWIVSLTLIFGICGYLFTKAFNPLTYTSSTTIYLTPQTNESGEADYNSQMSNSKLVTNVVNLMVQSNILTEVAKEVGLKDSNQIRNMLSIENQTDTEIIKVSATSTDPKLAKDVSTTTVNVFIERMQKNLNVRNIEIVNKAKLSYEPSGPNALRNAEKAALIGLVLGFAIAFIRMIFDRHLHNKEDVEAYLGIPVFCELPELNEQSNEIKS